MGLAETVDVIVKGCDVAIPVTERVIVAEVDFDGDTIDDGVSVVVREEVIDANHGDRD